MQAATVSQIDPFGRPYLEDPLPFQEELREAGPVVRLERYGIWAMARHEQVHAAISNWQVFSSARGVGLSDFATEPPWRVPSLVLEADPPLHSRTRAVLARILSPGTVRVLRDTFEREAAVLVEELVARRSFDAIADLAEVYPTKVFADAIGLPQEGRENLLPYGSMAFNAFGPRNWLFEEAMAGAGPVRQWIADKCERAALAPGSLGMQIHEAADAGELSPEEASLLVRSFLTAGIDTTVASLGATLWCFAAHPEQWRMLRENPGLVRPAFDEVLRFESPVQAFFRTTTQEIEVEGVRMGEGEKVLLLYGAANRDHRRWADPHVFDIARRPAGHLAFGVGIHGCVGQMVARLEAEAVLKALLPRAERLELAGAPVRRLNNTLRAFASVPVRVVAASGA